MGRTPRWYLANVGLDPGSGVLNLVFQQSIVHHFLQLVANGVAQVACRRCIRQVVVPAGKHHSGEGEQPVLAHKSAVAFSLRLSRSQQPLSHTLCRGPESCQPGFLPMQGMLSAGVGSCGLLQCTGGGETVLG